LKIILSSNERNILKGVENMRLINKLDEEINEFKEILDLAEDNIDIRDVKYLLSGLEITVNNIREQLNKVDNSLSEII
jgi:K+/H+ antiporter YhaU regulatory subunit KhtT